MFIFIHFLFYFCLRKFTFTPLEIHLYLSMDCLCLTTYWEVGCYMSKSSMYMFHLASPYVPFKPANMLPYMYGLPCISFSVILFESNLPISRHSVQFSSVQSLSHVQLFATPWTAARQGTLSITNSQSLLRLMSTESVMPLNHLILCHPLLLLPSIFPALGSFQMNQFSASGSQSI